MQLEDFQFEFPQELVASVAAEPRDAARLFLPFRKERRHDFRFSHLPELVSGEEIFVFNETRVIACRLFARRKTGGCVEVFLLNETRPGVWACLVHPARRLKTGEELSIEGEKDFRFEIHKECEGQWKAHLGMPYAEAVKFMDKHGHVPLPPYIKREDNQEDRQRYQTVFARKLGSVAAPTAGLHFTPELINKLKTKGCQTVFVTLHVGLGTFAPVTTNTIENHSIHEEEYEVDEKDLVLLDKSFREGREVVCVGTTSCRAVESALTWGPRGRTKAFFHPGQMPNFVRSLITNFHQPASTLFMLVCSLVGVEEAQKLYQEAFEEKYRLFSYGDGMWLRALN